MKVRLGITAPLVLTAADTGCLRWPCFVERNFTIGDQFQHSLWVESNQPLETLGAKLKAEQAEPQCRSDDLRSSAHASGAKL